MTKKRTYKKRAKKKTDEKADEKTKKVKLDTKKEATFKIDPDFATAAGSEKAESIENSMLPEKPFFRIDEVARYFDVSDRTVRMWIDHGHFEIEKLHGTTIRVLRESVLRFRLKSRVTVP